MHGLVRFDSAWAGESRHSLHKDSSHRGQAGRTCKARAGQESKMARKPQWKRWPLRRKKVVTAPAHEPEFVLAIVGLALQQPDSDPLLL